MLREIKCGLIATFKHAHFYLFKLSVTSGVEMCEIVCVFVYVTGTNHTMFLACTFTGFSFRDDILQPAAASFVSVVDACCMTDRV